MTFANLGLCSVIFQIFAGLLFIFLNNERNDDQKKFTSYADLENCLFTIANLVSSDQVVVNLVGVGQFKEQLFKRTGSALSGTVEEWMADRGIASNKIDDCKEEYKELALYTIGGDSENLGVVFDVDDKKVTEAFYDHTKFKLVLKEEEEEEKTTNKKRKKSGTSCNHREMIVDFLIADLFAQPSVAIMKKLRSGDDPTEDIERRLAQLWEVESEKLKISLASFVAKYPQFKK